MANLTLFPFLKKDPVQNLTIPFRQAGQDFPNLAGLFLGFERQLRGDLLAGPILRGSGQAPLLAVDLKQNVIADGIDESPECAGTFEPVLAQVPQHAEEGLLDSVFNEIGRAEAGPELGFEESPEIVLEVTLSLRFGLYQTMQVSRIEGLTLHDDRYYTTPGTYLRGKTMERMAERKQKGGSAADGEVKNGRTIGPKPPDGGVHWGRWARGIPKAKLPSGVCRSLIRHRPL
jgi:hypothetical protein